MPWTTQKRIRLIVYEGTEENFHAQFGTPERPRGLPDGTYDYATKITVVTITNPTVVQALIDCHVPAGEEEE